MNKSIDYTEDTKSKFTAGMFTSRTEEWETPQYIFDILDEEFHFSLDVCATYANAKCKHFFDKQINGLKQDWWRYCIQNKINPTAWMNPPYGKEIHRWMLKAYNESQKGMTIVCLVHARTDTQWWHECAMKADEIRLVKGRLKFGDGKQSAPFPSCIVIFRSSFESSHVYNSPLCKSVTFNPRARRQADIFGRGEGFVGAHRNLQ